MTFDWHMLYPLHRVISDNSQVFGGVPCKAQLCNCSKWFFSPCFGVVPIWELWQFCYVRIEPPKKEKKILRGGVTKCPSLGTFSTLIPRTLSSAPQMCPSNGRRTPTNQLPSLGHFCARWRRGCFRNRGGSQMSTTLPQP